MLVIQQSKTCMRTIVILSYIVFKWLNKSLRQIIEKETLYTICIIGRYKG